MGSNFTIQKTHFRNIQVSEFPLIPSSLIFNFISISRISPQFKPLIRCSSSLSISSSSSSQASISGNSSPELSFEASYLKNTFELPPELAISRAKYLKFNNSPEKPEKVLEFLKKHGFTKTQVSSMVYSLPQLLLSRPETTILPKLQFLTSVGFSRTEITGVVTSAPMITQRSLENVVVPAYNLLRSLLGSDDKASAFVNRYPMILTRAPEVGNIQILREVGVPEAHIVYSMCHRSRGYRSEVDYRRIVEEVLEMGFDPTSMKFLRAIRTLRSMSKSTWEHKVEIFKKFGWTDQEILVAFEKDQNFITSSEDKIVRIMDFLKRMGVETRTTANWPKIFSLSIEKRIVPRSLVYQVMVEKGLCKRKKKLNIFTLVSFTENQFLDEVIKPCGNEAPKLLDFYQEMLDT